MNQNNKRLITWFNLIFFISTTTIFTLFYLIQKNNFIYYNQDKKNLKKQLTFYTNQIISQQGDITGLRRADRIRTIAENNLKMYIPIPESLVIYIDE